MTNTQSHNGATAQLESLGYKQEVGRGAWLAIGALLALCLRGREQLSTAPLPSALSASQSTEQ